MAGARLGPYEIVSLLGAGGMGEVYRARDTRLDRVVAVKILPTALAADPEFRERFDREARAISQLTHPHICTLYDVGEAPSPEPSRLRSIADPPNFGEARQSAEGAAAAALSPDMVRFLVLEYLEGDSLADRLEKGPIALDAALKIAIEIADALAAAHRAGIVHRDPEGHAAAGVAGVAGRAAVARSARRGLPGEGTRRTPAVRAGSAAAASLDS